MFVNIYFALPSYIKELPKKECYHCHRKVFLVLSGFLYLLFLFHSKFKVCISVELPSKLNFFTDWLFWLFHLSYSSLLLDSCKYCIFLQLERNTDVRCFPEISETEKHANIYLEKVRLKRFHWMIENLFSLENKLHFL